MIKGAHHVAISVSDLDRSIDFYTKILGMEIIAPPFPLEGPLLEEVLALPELRARMCVVRRNSLMIELFEFVRPTPAPKDPGYPVCDHGITHFGIEVADADAAHARLSAAGVRFHTTVKTFPRGVKATYGRDPDGNVFELLEMPKSAAG